MKSAIHKKYGSPQVLEIAEITKPEPADDEVLINVFAATVNRTDCAMLRAKPFIMRFFTGLFRPANQISGTDFAGTIEAVGKNVDSFKIGDRVFGFDDAGLSSHAQYLCISEKKAMTTIPDNFSFKEAAATIEGAHYAYNFINKIDLKPGEKVLVNGATGAIGSAAVQLLKYYNASVTAVCRQKDTALVQSLGAQKVIDYTLEDFTLSEEKFNYIFDTAGKSRFTFCRPLLLPGGAYISSEPGPMAENLFMALAKPLMGSKKVIFPVPSKPLETLILVKKLIEEGMFKAVIDKTYALEEIIDAFEYVQSGQKIGSVILSMEKNKNAKQNDE
jgi:NADPH:quinone reductase-like Zn-dependent oxidoreductase